MKGLVAMGLLVVLWSCQDQENVSDFTGNEIAYELIQGSEYNVSGSVTFKERKDGFTTVVVQLNGTSGNIEHPVHVHLGTLATPQAEVAVLLSPVAASTGLSETILNKLANETPVTYSDISKLDACIKIHLADSGAGRDVVLAGGNIGASYLKEISSGRQSGIATCKSN